MVGLNGDAAISDSVISFQFVAVSQLSVKLSKFSGLANFSDLDYHLKTALFSAENSDIFSAIPTHAFYVGYEVSFVLRS